jgi:hypothetical protein
MERRMMKARLTRCRPLLALLGALVVLDGCRLEAPHRFKQQPPGRTGVTFANTITTSDSVNLLTDPYIYNGGGVGVGDIDNDGLPDIFFGGNMVSSRLYLNKGNMRFEDITQSAGVATHGWASGVSMVDINHDGYLDIYVAVGPVVHAGGKSQSALHQQRQPHVHGVGRLYQLDDGFTAQAAFLDADRDGDLDVFLLGSRDFAQPDGAAPGRHAQAQSRRV